MLTGDLLKEQFGPNVNLYMLGMVITILVLARLHRSWRRGGSDASSELR
jgi:hypothetical protein